MEPQSGKLNRLTTLLIVAWSSDPASICRSMSECLHFLTDLHGSTQIAANRYTHTDKTLAVKMAPTPRYKSNVLRPNVWRRKGDIALSTQRSRYSATSCLFQIVERVRVLLLRSRPTRVTRRATTPVYLQMMTEISSSRSSTRAYCVLTPPFRRSECQYAELLLAFLSSAISPRLQPSLKNLLRRERAFPFETSYAIVLWTCIITTVCAHKAVIRYR